MSPFLPNSSNCWTSFKIQLRHYFSLKVFANLYLFYHFMLEQPLHLNLSFLFHKLLLSLKSFRVETICCLSYHQHIISFSYIVEAKCLHEWRDITCLFHLYNYIYRNLFEATAHLSLYYSFHYITPCNIQRGSSRNIFDSFLWNSHNWFMLFIWTLFDVEI